MGAGAGAQARVGMKRVKVDPKPRSSALNQPCRLNKLPDEIILCIFHHLDCRDLLHGTALTCKRWRTIALDRSLWRERSLGNDELKTLADLSLLASAPALGELSLDTTLPTEAVLTALLKGDKNIRRLRLFFRKKVLSVEQIKTLFLHYPNLEELEIQLPTSYRGKTVEICLAFHPLGQLRVLELHGLVFPLAELARTLIDYCPVLRSLHIGTSLLALHDDDLQGLMADGRAWLSLKILAYFLSESSYLYFSRCHELHQLTLLKCKSLSEPFFLQLAQLTKLKSLTISENRILTATALSTFFLAPTMSNLVEINLTVYSADDEVAFAISTNCKQLVRLRIAMSLLTDEGVRRIITNATNLEDLDLAFNNIRGQSLYLIPTNLPSLTYLNLHLCYNVVADLGGLVARLPSLLIVEPNGGVINGSLVKACSSFPHRPRN